MADDNNENENEKKRQAKEYVESGDAKLRSKDWAGAIEAYTKAIELDPNNVDTYASRGFANSNLGNHQQALADCNTAIDL
ncbi:MAG: tetratricopeptide repeat protein, partial [Alphaproteobacteria bacterium]|nr:tetratricopeptide repeat protein [Alphaproteobacteria bacterium]